MPSRLLTAAAALGLGAAVLWTWFTGALGPWYFDAARTQGARAAVLTADLRADIEARAIRGLSRNTSGLTYSAATGTLFAVVNAPPLVAEIGLDGDLLRTIPIAGLADPEGITHLAGEVFLISDEGDQSIHRVAIGPWTRRLAAGGPALLALGFGFQPNMGFEGASWDTAGARLFLAQEMLPNRILTVTGLAPAGEGGPLAVREWPLPWLHRLALVDISSLTLHEASGHLLVLSHQSGMVLEYDAEGRLAGSLPLRAGRHGLRQSVAQPEGIAIGPGGEVFVVSEPNLFHRFTRP